MRNTILRFLMVSTAAAMLLQLGSDVSAQSPDWESALTTMKNGANMMIEGGSLMHRKKDQGSADRMIKDGHRMMMDAEKSIIKTQNDLMRQGANMMLEGLQVLKAKNDVAEAEKLMSRGQQMIVEADKRMTDPRPEKLMQGSRTMMRGLRMRQQRDLNASDKLMTEGRGMMLEAQKAGSGKK